MQLDDSGVSGLPNVGISLGSAVLPVGGEGPMPIQPPAGPHQRLMDPLLYVGDVHWGTLCGKTHEEHGGTLFGGSLGVALFLRW
jgi:hypothetical protein